MPFTRGQNFLKNILPSNTYRLVYNIALFIYRLWVDICDYSYYGISLIYYLITWQGGKAHRVGLICKIRPYTMVGRQGLMKTYDIAEWIEDNNKAGCFVECGVARGGCSAIMALVGRRSNRHLWLFDSFEGMGKPSVEDEHTGLVRYKPKDRASDIVLPGYCLGTYDEVNTLLFSKLKLNSNNISIVKGWFEDTLPEYKSLIGSISLLRIDCDWYEPTKSGFLNLYDNVVSGGFIIIDDYNSYIGCKKATDEFINSRGLKLVMEFDNRGGCYIQKGSS